jgi:hypothetical protein
MKLDKKTKARLAGTYNFAKWSKPSSPALLAAPAVSAARIEGYDLLSTRKMNPDKDVALHHHLWSRSGETQPAVSLQIYETADVSKARDLTLYVLGQFEGPPLEPARRTVGDVAFSTPGHRLVVAQKQNLVFLISNIGDKAADLSGFATALNEAVGPQGTGSRPSRKGRKN